MIFTGDFFQLPPVGLGQYGRKFAFHANCFSADIQMLELTTVVRQKGDDTFISLLNEVRVGVCSEHTIELLRTCHVDQKIQPDDGILPTNLYCMNKDVNAENIMFLNKLTTESRAFRATDIWVRQSDDGTSRKIMESMESKAVRDLTLKIGAQVMCTRNLPHEGLVNGSRGVVVGFDDDAKDEEGEKTSKPVVKYDNGLTVSMNRSDEFQGQSGGALKRVQFPLKLAWSLTIHKSQGTTLSRAILSLHDAFDYGQVYVALSRLSSIAGLWIRGPMINQSAVKCSKEVRDFYEDKRRTESKK